MVSLAYIGLGSNLAAPGDQVERALAALDRLAHTRVTARSHLYRTAPWGYPDQPDFINAVAALETALDAHALMHGLLAIERDSGRQRDGVRFGPRVLDLDLLLYADARIDEPGLHVPHPRLQERAFVLVPLAEIAPLLDVPGQGRLDALLAQVDSSQCRMLASA